MHESLRNLPLDALKGFAAAARHLSFTKAAAELFLTQSALSKQIKGLEEALGFALFTRNTRAIELTEAGSLLFGTVERLLADLAGTVARLQSTPNPAAVTVSTTPAFASLWLIPRLGSFRAQHPDIGIFISADNRLVDLAREPIDVAIRFYTDARASPAWPRLFGETMLPVMSPKLLQNQRVRHPRDLTRFVLLHLDDPLYQMPWMNWSTWFAAHGVPDLQQQTCAGSLHFSQYNLLIQAAVEGQGIALGRRPLVDHLLDTGQLVVPLAAERDNINASRSYFLVRSERTLHCREVSAFVDWLHVEAARLQSETAQGKLAP